MFLSSETPSNFILYPSRLALLISTLSIFVIPSIFIFLLLIKELNERAVSIFNFEATSSPFISEEGLLSAYPKDWAFLKHP